MLSGVCDSYKWFSCNKVPIDVILKYAQRYASLIVNITERKAIICYMKKSKRWCKYISEDINIFGSMSNKHVFYTPDFLQSGIRYGLNDFKKPFIKFYSRKQPVGIFNVSTPFEVSLSVKNSTSVFEPTDILIDRFINYSRTNNINDSIE